LTAAIREANAAILDRAAGDPGLWGVDTTVTAAAWAGERHLQLAHVGDSRAYLLRDGSLEQLTTDHTVVGELVRRGRLTPEQAAVHPERSILTRAVGLHPPLPAHSPPPPPAPPGPAGAPSIPDLLTAGPDGDAACRALIDAANDAGGPDNIT